MARLNRGRVLMWAAALAACAAAGCKSQGTAAEKPRPVMAVTVKQVPLSQTRTLAGEIRARVETDVGFQLAGKIIARPVSVGDTVKKGQVVARLDDQDQRNAVISAEADVSTATAQLAEARTTEERQRILIEKKVNTQARYDESLTKLKTAEARLESAKAQLQTAKDRLSYTILVSDADGVVTATSAEPGEVVAAGQKVVRIAQGSDIDAVLDVPEAAFVGFERPAKPPEVEVWLSAAPTVRTVGRVREVSPSADAQTRTYRVKVGLESPPSQMRLGATIVGRLVQQGGSVVELAASALFDDKGKPAVWVVDPKSRAVSLKPVTVDRFDSEKVVVSSGLADGETVVVAGVHSLRPGQIVRLLERPSP